jgi:hypothetical protein
VNTLFPTVEVVNVNDSEYDVYIGRGSLSGITMSLAFMEVGKKSSNNIPMNFSIESEQIVNFTML